MNSIEGNSNGFEFIEVEKKYNSNKSLFCVVEMSDFSKQFKYNVTNSFFEISPYKNFSDNSVVIEFVGAQNDKIYKEQLNALEDLRKNEVEIVLKIKKKIYEYYQKYYAVYLQGVEGFATHTEISELFPKIQNGTELDDKIALNYIMIYPPHNGKSKMNLRFWWKVDDKDIGVIIKDSEIVDIGTDLGML